MPEIACFGAGFVLQAQEHTGCTKLWQRIKDARKMYDNRQNIY